MKSQSFYAMIASGSLALLACVGKCFAFTLTQSPAILADAAESVVHLLSTVLAACSLRYAEIPPDEDHPYGHAKIVYFSAGVEALIISFGALAILWMACRALFSDFLVGEVGVASVLLSLLALANGALGYILCRMGRSQHHHGLSAHGNHLLTDMWSGVAVISGVLIAKWSQWTWLDPLVALLVGLHILWTGIRLLKSSFDGLMERSCPHTQHSIQTLLQAAVNIGNISGFHALKHRYVNNNLWIDVHLEFPGDKSLRDVHDIASGLEMHLEKAFPKDRVWITTHLEPTGHEEAHPEGHFEFQ